MEARILRDLRQLTKLLILLEISTTTHHKLKTIADKLEITPQAVSDYLKIMGKEDLIQNIGGEYRATKKGVDFLHENFIHLKSFVDTKMNILNIIDLCGAMAKTKIKNGDKVGLFMEDGVLTAYTDKESNSKGTALQSAQIGEDVAIKGLEGMVVLKPGRVYILKLPNIKDGGTRRVPLDQAKRICKGFEKSKIAITDNVARAMVNKLELRADFEFAPELATVEALQKGLNIMFFTSNGSDVSLLSRIENINLSSEDKIDYKIFNL